MFKRMKNLEKEVTELKSKVDTLEVAICNLSKRLVTEEVKPVEVKKLSRSRQDHIEYSRNRAYRKILKMAQEKTEQIKDELIMTDEDYKKNQLFLVRTIMTDVKNNLNKDSVLDFTQLDVGEASKYIETYKIRKNTLKKLV